MPDVNQKVLAMVRREMEKNPAVTNDVLQQKAATIDRTVRKLNRRQFHGTYRLTASRALASAGSAKPKSKTARTRARGPVAKTRTARSSMPSAAHSGNGPDRAAIRATLLELAGEIAKAESNTDIIGVLGSLDHYVNRIRNAMSA